MSHYDYTFSQSDALMSGPFYGIIMAAMRRADTDNLELLQRAFPETWEELQQRYHAPGGYLPNEIQAAATGVLSEPPMRVVRATMTTLGKDLMWSCWDNGQHVLWAGYNDEHFWSGVCDAPHWKTKTIEGRTYTLNVETSEVTIAEAVPA